MNVNVLLRSLVKTCGMLVQMFSLSWQLTLLTFVEMPLLALLQNYYNIHYQVTDLRSTYLTTDLGLSSFPMLNLITLANITFSCIKKTILHLVFCFVTYHQTITLS